MRASNCQVLQGEVLSIVVVVVVQVVVATNQLRGTNNSTFETCRRI